MTTPTFPVLDLDTTPSPVELDGRALADIFRDEARADVLRVLGPRRSSTAA